MERDAQIKVRVSRAEWGRINAQAKANGLSLSEWVRQVAGADSAVEGQRDLASELTLHAAWLERLDSRLERIERLAEGAT